MKKMTAVFFALCITVSTFAAGKGWLTNIDEAMKLSAKTGKPILLEFAGSNWCPPCMRLKKEVFDQKEFKDFAKDNLILILADFPRPSNLSEKQKLHNQKLASKYKIRYFPTVLLLDSKGKVIFQTGYKRGGAAKYVAHLKAKLPAKKTAKK
jgi:thioredoxin-related protein